MNTPNGNKKGTSNIASATKSEKIKDQPTDSKKGMEQKDEKKPEPASAAKMNVTKSDKENKNTKNK
jgi:hypothetical protein